MGDRTMFGSAPISQSDEASRLPELHAESRD